ncbi:DegT/DnrJ/EryC1/StrS family aminotransferase [Mobilicoccus caccae]|uniref:LPS biosynthesis protein n=1 Tax=Mobilicoccus caccae TaxID=1859295 RepID=A0ABQ6INC1_9MICO|nr:DegT/DnrJ/EryC1/StrS family aminotransferase [Mobilicoccus caccae]GMA38672.1 LPS biosynthesis protein [Mobilicoccus caccae]
MSEKDLPVPFAAPDIGDAEIDAVVEAMRSGWLTTGPRAAAFETEFAEFLGGDLHAVALNSATAGLHLALEALGIGPGDEVIVPTWTFTATAEVVRYLGADPVIVDVDDDLLIDLEATEAAITPRTRAVMPVHLAGMPVERGALAALAERHGLAVVEDAAHSFPARSSGTMVGAGASEAVVFSFYATKTMTTGEGGMVVTADPELARRIRTMRLHGISRDVFDRYSTPGAGWAYDVVAPGYKYNLTDPAAAMGRVQLRRAGAMRDARASIAARYDEAFADLPVDLPPHAHRPDDVHAWHLYVLRLRPEAPIDRDTFITRLGEVGIGASVHFIPLHRHPYWAQTYGLSDADYPTAERHFPTVVSLPLSSGLSQAQVDKVVATVRTLLGGR